MEEDEKKPKIEILQSNMCYDVVTRKLRVKYGLEPEVEESKEELQVKDENTIKGLENLDWDQFDKLTGKIQQQKELIPEEAWTQIDEPLNFFACTKKPFMMEALGVLQSSW